MIVAGSLACSSLNRRSSSISACFENTLKFTPPKRTVAPRGAGTPRVMSRLAIARRSGPCLARNNRSHFPNVATILPDRTIGRKSTDACGVEYRHPGPAILIGIRVAHALLAVHVGLIVGQEHVVVANEQ